MLPSPPLGDTPQTVHEALCRGETGLKEVTLFSTEGSACTVGGEIADFSPREYLPTGNLRPLDRAAQLAAIAAAKALEDAGCTPEMRRDDDVGLVLGTLFGSIHTISAFDRRALEAGPKYAKPLDFANSVINAPAGQTAIWHDLRGVNSTVCCGTGSGLQAISYGANLIRTGRADTLLAGGADELCFESFLGFHRTGRVAGSCRRPEAGEAPRPIPFAAGRNGFALGEGAALFLLEERDQALARGATILGEVRGYGNAFDPSRGRDAARAAKALQRSVEEALREARVKAGRLGAISTSANGSPAGDLHEARALAAALDGAPKCPPVTAIKGGLGESLGAGGAIQAITLLESLTRRRLPGIGGLVEAAPDLPLEHLSHEAREVAYPVGLASALDTDGHACALVLEAADTN